MENSQLKHRNDAKEFVPGTFGSKEFVPCIRDAKSSAPGTVGS